MSTSIAKAKMGGKHIIAGLLLLLTSACDRSPVKSVEANCSLNGFGTAECTFKNPGSSTASVCGHIVLRSKNDGTLLAKLHRGLTDDFADKLTVLLRSTPSDKLEELPVLVRGVCASFAYSKASSIPTVVSFQEVCSGLIEAGDVRNVSATLSFGYAPGMSQSSPYDLCKQLSGDGWPESCTFEFVSVDEVMAALRHFGYGT